MPINSRGVYVYEETDLDSTASDMLNRQSDALTALLTANGAKVLATSPGEYLTAAQSLTLSESIQDQPTGIILVWCEYLNGAATNASWNYAHIPKYARPISGGIALPLTHYDGTLVRKYVYVSTNGKTVTGHAQNSVAPANKLVIRAVLGY